MKPFGILIIAGVLFAGILNSAAQNCGCSPNLCCSQFGFCGSDEAYCGAGCQQGPCFSAPPTNNVDVGSIVTDAFFNGIVDQSDAGCEGRGFYTRAAFLEALGNYGQFGRVGSEEDSRREIAAFFAHVTHETGRKTMLLFYATLTIYGLFDRSGIACGTDMNWKICTLNTTRTNLNKTI